MKKINVLFLLLFALGMSFTSCTRDFEDGGNYNGSNNGIGGNGNGSGKDTIIEGPGVFKATVDGRIFTANTVQAIVNDDYIAISGLKTATGELIQITLPNSKVGTYTFKDNADDKNNFALAYAKDSEWAYIGVSNDKGKGHPGYHDTAVVKITSIDKDKKTISGTFQFTGVRFDDAEGLVAITEGSFTKISYKEDAPIIQANNKFSAKIDGEDFTATNVSAIKTMGKIAITGNRGSLENISLFLPGDVKEGTYTLGTMDTDYTIRYNKDMSPGNMFDAKKGSTITISKHDKVKKTISGTFSATEITYTTTEKYEITEGSFSVLY